MVAISLTHESAREMANRLRQFLAAGGTSIKQTHAYEALAKALGYRDWNTLHGLLEPGGESTPAPDQPPWTMLLLLDRHAMAAHGVTVAQVEAGFRREFPALLDAATRWEALCHEQLPLSELPAFRPPVVSISLRTPDKAHVHDAVMDRVHEVAEPKWTWGELARPGEPRFTFMFPPERDVDALIPALAAALARLPPEIAVTAIDKVVPGPDHPVFGTWQTDGVLYFVWAWDRPPLTMQDQRLLASMALKFNGDVLVRLRDVASLHAGVRKVRAVL